MGGAPLAVSATGSGVQAGIQDSVRTKNRRDHSIKRERVKGLIYLRMDISKNNCVHSLPRRADSLTPYNAQARFKFPPVIPETSFIASLSKSGFSPQSCIHLTMSLKSH